MLLELVSCRLPCRPRHIPMHACRLREEEFEATVDPVRYELAGIGVTRSHDHDAIEDLLLPTCRRLLDLLCVEGSRKITIDTSSLQMAPCAVPQPHPQYTGTSTCMHVEDLHVCTRHGRSR